MLREGDLKNTVLKRISLDEYEPKTGEDKDVMVLGFLLNDKKPGKDLYHFLNNSIVEIRDVEVSPNPKCPTVPILTEPYVFKALSESPGFK